MKIIAITKSGGYYNSVQGALVEMSGEELNALVGKRKNAAELGVGDKLDITKNLDDVHRLRREFNDLGKTAAHLRSVADKMDEFPLPEWSRS